jgi:hypothetical protein
MTLIPPQFARAVWPALALAALAMPAVHANTIYATSFENPPFTTGAIAGQDGWSVFGPGISTVENSFAKTGSQAVFVDGGTATQSGPFHTDVSTGPLVDLSADIAIFTSSTQSEWQFAGLGPGLIGFLGGIDILPNNLIKAITLGYPIIGTFPRATAFDSRAWHHVDLLFDIATQTYNISLDGSTLAANVPFCGDNHPCAGATVSTYANGLFDSFGAQSTGGATANDSGYLDNYRVANVSAVPEPSSALLLVAVLGATAFVLRRKFSVDA